MLNKEEIFRYSRHLLLPEIGIEGQEKFKAARVLVIGAGGLGCPALLYLTAMGIGEIGIVDFDKVDASNLQRQVLYSTEDIGKLKVEAAASRLSKQNPFVKINPYNIRLDNKNALDIICDYDVVIDGSDNFSTRYLVNDACVILNKPLVYGSVYKFQGQLSVLNFNKPEKLGPTYRCIFPSPPKPESSPNCSEIGVLGILPGIIGTLQATEVIKIISGLGDPLSGKLLLLDALTINFSIIEIERCEQWMNSAPKNKEEFLKMDYEFVCENNSDKYPVKSISANELKEKIKKNEIIQILDVREPAEFPQIDELNDLRIPLGNISNQTDLISKDKIVIVFCKSGVRSKKAIELLENSFGFTNLYNLAGGITEWMKAKPELSLINIESSFLTGETNQEQKNIKVK